MASILRPGAELERTGVARNTSALEAGSIHDDAEAARHGYRDGLVPGVTLLAYLTPLLIEAFGDAWPQRGRLSARFLRPVYEGESVSLRVSVAEGGQLDCAVAGEDGVVRVEGEASCADEAPEREPAPWRRGIPGGGPALMTPDGALPPLEPESMAVGQELSPLTYRLPLEETARWASEVDDAHPWYRDASPFGGPLVHPAMFMRDPIRLLRHNFAYKAIVHAATDIAYQHAALPGRDYTAYGYVAELYERKGNSYAVVDSLTVDQDGREIARQSMTAVVRLRTEG